MDYQQEGPITEKGSYIPNLLYKRNTFAPPVFITKGTMTSTLGGRTTFKDINGGTLLTYDPKTGTITIFGGLVTQQNVNVGTLMNSTLAGTISNTGLINGGTVKGLLQGTFNGVISSGTVQSALMSGGTFTAPTISGTSTYDQNAGSTKLGANGNFAIQTFGTAGILAWRVGGTTFYINPTGTLT